MMKPQEYECPELKKGKKNPNNLNWGECSLEIQATLLNQVSDSQLSDLILFFN